MQGNFLRDITVQSCAPNLVSKSISSSSHDGRNNIYELELQNLTKTNNNITTPINIEKKKNSSLLYMTEAYLNAERVIMAVVRTVLKKQLQNFKFMGITSSEVSLNIKIF